MREYLTNYLRDLEAMLESGSCPDYRKLRNDHLIMIGFMQHERLIHFLVTILFALGFFITLGIYLVTEILMLAVLLILILALLIPYIMHYYFLENSVQKMYKLYDEINRRCGDTEQNSAQTP